MEYINLEEHIKEKGLRELDFIADFMDRDMIFIKIIIPILSKKITKFYKENKKDFTCYVDCTQKPISLPINNLEYVGEKDTLKDIINNYFYNEIYDIYFDEIWNCREEKAYELIIKFINENLDIKPYFNMDFDIYATSYNIDADEELEIKVTSFVIENIMDYIIVDFFKYGLENLVLEFGRSL